MRLSDDDRVQGARLMIESLPFSRALKMRIEEIDIGMAQLSMPWSAELVGDPELGIIHGGAVSALLDSCGGAAVISALEPPGITATLDLRIDYMRPAPKGERIFARAECHHVTRSVAFVRARAWAANPDKPVAIATGAFTAAQGKGPQT